MIICAFDDRVADILGLKLLVCSLARHLPDVPVHLACPVADGEFRSWLLSYPQVTLDDSPELKGKGWDAKPLLLRQLLEKGHDTVLWMDSDIIVTRDFRGLLPNDGSLVVAEEPWLNRFGVKQRTTGWGFAIGRALPGVNTCIVRANAGHLGLIRTWQELLQHPDYQRARTLPFELRMPHVLGDQDVLLGLLGSGRFLEVDVHVLRAGREIIQSCGVHGYPPMHRLAHLLRGLPPLVHSQNHKPWRLPDASSLGRMREFLLQLHLETAPYTHFARQYRQAIQPFPTCLEIRSLIGRLSDIASLGQPALRGFVQALAVSNWRHLCKAAELLHRGAGKFYRTAIRGRTQHSGE
jgi:hypothetical protein